MSWNPLKDIGGKSNSTQPDQGVFTPISNDATRVAALLSGEIDLMYPVPLQDVKRLNNDPNTEALEGPELRTIFLGYDQWRDESLDMPDQAKILFGTRVSRRSPYDQHQCHQARRHEKRCDSNRLDDRSRNQWFPKGHE